MDSKRYSQLLTDLRTDYRPQREWGEGKGVLMVIGHFVVGIAGGAWILSYIYGQFAGLAAAYVLGIVGGIVHLMFLGNPQRAFGMMRHYRTSWVSRGFIGLSLFLAGGFVYLVLYGLATGQPTGALAWLANAVTMLGAVTIVGYMGFCYTASKGIPFWHSPLHPAIYIAFAFRGGLALLMIVYAVTRAEMGPWLVEMWVTVTAVIALFFVLEIQGALASGNIAARWSVRDLLSGRVSMIFYGGTLLLGLVLPLLLIWSSSSLTPLVIIMIGLASAVGDLFMKLSTVKAGVYLPLLIPARGRAL